MNFQREKATASKKVSALCRLVVDFSQWSEVVFFCLTIISKPELKSQEALKCVRSLTFSRPRVIPAAPISYLKK